MQFCIQSYVDIGEIIPYLQANPNWLKTKNINSSIFFDLIFLIFFLFFRPGFFRKEKRRTCCILIFFSTELLFRRKLWIHNKTDVFKTIFVIRRFIHFYDSLNILLILDPNCEFFCAKPYQENSKVI